jgi:hypothetical protein
MKISCITLQLVSIDRSKCNAPKACQIEIEKSQTHLTEQLNKPRHFISKQQIKI